MERLQNSWLPFLVVKVRLRKFTMEKVCIYHPKELSELFAKSSNPYTSVFLQDGDTSLNVAPVKEALTEVNAETFPIPASSTNTNLIKKYQCIVSRTPASR